MADLILKIEERTEKQSKESVRTRRLKFFMANG